jgi:Ribbon-helix-helix protein, copG family
MSHRLQVLIPAELDAQLSKAAQRSSISKGEWVRRALEESLRRGGKNRSGSDPVARLAKLNAPTADIDRMLAEIEAGRS